MKKVIVLILMCIVIIKVNAQPTNYNGWYQNPNISDRLLNTAISDFVSGDRTLIIDTYYDNANSRNYLLFTFISDATLAPVSQQIKWYDPSIRDIYINDVKYDAVNNQYVACGLEEASGLNLSDGLIMAISPAGNIIWRNSAWNTSGYGADEYRRVKVVNSSSNFGTFYATVGWGESILSGLPIRNGIISFYDPINGNCIYMEIPQSGFNNLYNSEYTDLVYNSTVDEIVLVGKYNGNVAQTSNIYGLVKQRLCLSISPMPPNLWYRNIYTSAIENPSIAFDNVSRYYITGAINSLNPPAIYVEELDANLLVLNKKIHQIPTLTINRIEVKDMCFNPFPSTINKKIAVTGLCLDDLNGSTICEGFLFEINTNGLSTIPNGFSVWSGHRNLNPPPPYYSIFFDHIIARANNYVNSSGNSIEYSYILYGEPEVAAPNYSVIAEYYPAIPTTLICQEQFEDYIQNDIVIDEDDDFTVTLLPFDNFHALFDTPFQTMLNDVCYPPYYSQSFSNRLKTGLKNELKLNYTIDGNIIILNEDYTNSGCNIYSIDGKLIMKKQQGVSSINSNGFIPGIYFLQPLDNKILKPFKINIVH